MAILECMWMDNVFVVTGENFATKQSARIQCGLLRQENIGVPNISGDDRNVVLD